MKRAPTIRLCIGMVATLCAVVAHAAAQGSAEDRYIATRDQAVARFDRDKVKTLTKRIEAEEKRIRADLERQMRAILGTVRPQGFDAGKLNVSSLFNGDGDFGKLDGLVFEADGGDTEMIVTTRTLLARWLRAQQELWKDSTARQPDAAIRSEAFYTRAINTDAAIVRFVELPLGVPAGPSAYAMLAGRTQDQAPGGAGEVFVAALKGERAFIANTTLKPMFAIAACTVARAAAEKKLDEMSVGGQPAGDAGQALIERFNAMRDTIGADFLRCFAERAPQDPRFADAVKLAKELYERMPAR